MSMFTLCYTSLFSEIVKTCSLCVMLQVMFYSYDVLNPRTGKLSVLWLVANNRLKYSKRQDKNFREVMAVNIPRSWSVGNLKTCF